MPALTEYNCPHCHRLTILDSTRPLDEQKCHLCTKPFRVHRSSKTRLFAGMPNAAELWMDLGDSKPLPKHHDRWLLKTAVAGGAVILVALAWVGLRPRSAEPSAFVPHPAAPYFDAKTLANQVLAAPSIATLLPLVREGPGVREMMEKSPLPLGGKILSLSPATTFDGHAVQRVNLQTDSGRHLRLFVESRDGKFLADWPSFVGASDLTMAQLLQQRPTSPVLMRVLVAATDHALPPFEDVRKWFCIRMFAPGQEESCYGYLALTNPALASLTRRIPLHSDEATPEERAENEGIALPLALRVAFPESGATTDQVEVVEVVGSGWFIP